MDTYRSPDESIVQEGNILVDIEPFTSRNHLQRSPVSPLQSPSVIRQRTDKMIPQKVTRNYMCKVCKLQLRADTQVVTCAYCSEHYHAACVGYTNEFIQHFITEKKAPYICLHCNNNNSQYAKIMSKKYQHIETGIKTAFDETMNKMFAEFRNELETHKIEMKNEIERYQLPNTN